MQPPLREDIRDTERVIEMPMADEDITGPGQSRRTAPDIEGEAGRVNAKPGLLARYRMSFDRHLSQPQHGGTGGEASRRQIS